MVWSQVPNVKRAPTEIGARFFVAGLRLRLSLDLGEGIHESLRCQ